MLPGQEYQLFQSLLQAYGRQSWWPADTPFEVMLGAILTQNTAWTNVEKAIAELKRRGLLDVNVLLQTSVVVVAESIRASGYFNVKARRILAFCDWCQQQGGLDVLDTMETNALRRALLTVHGVGPETADDILLYAFERPVFVIDAYTRRVFARVGLASGDEPYDILRHQVEQVFNDNVGDMNEFHALIVRHAKIYCRKQAQCRDCVVQVQCSYAG